jgi:cytohesin|tara:strand:- start:1223 stop:2383 length:1161 start_codon:yes stop_codon:yes gene_type:complete
MSSSDSEKGDQLVDACKRGDLVVARELLDAGVSIESINIHGKTCLMLAAGNGHLNLVRLLLDRAANVNARSPAGDTALIDCFVPEISRMLLTRGSEVNVYGANGHSALSRAASSGDLSLVQDLLRHDAEIEPPGGNGLAPLQTAAASDRIDVATFLLQRGANVNYRDRALGGTPLSDAATRASAEMVSLLLAHGADVRIVNERGDIALHNAAGNCNLEAMALLLQSGSHLEAQGELGFTPLISAASNRAVWKTEDKALPAVVLLLKEKANPNKADRAGYTPLHHAAYDGFKRVADVLLEAGADPGAENRKGERPIELAMKRGIPGYPNERESVRPESKQGDPNYEVVELLLKLVKMDPKRYRKLRKSARQSRCPEVLKLLTAARPR